MNKTIFLATAMLAAIFFTSNVFAEEFTAKEKQIYEEIKAACEDSIFYGTNGDVSEAECQKCRDNIKNKYGVSETDIKGILSKAADGMIDEEMTICEETIVELAREQAKPGFTRESIDWLLGEIAAKRGISVQELKDLVYKFAVL